MKPKTCIRCGENGPFYKDAQKIDGLRPYCKECDNESSNRYKREHVEERREYNRNWFQKNKVGRRPSNLRHVKAYQERYPERARARWNIQSAIRRGKINRQPCEICGGKSEAHHDNYSKPQEVRWLCTKHHAQLRRKVVHYQT